MTSSLEAWPAKPNESGAKRRRERGPTSTVSCTGLHPELCIHFTVSYQMLILLCGTDARAKLSLRSDPLSRNRYIGLLHHGARLSPARRRCHGTSRSHRRDCSQARGLQLLVEEGRSAQVRVLVPAFLVPVQIELTRVHIQHALRWSLGRWHSFRF